MPWLFVGGLIALLAHAGSFYELTSVGVPMWAAILINFVALGIAAVIADRIANGTEIVGLASTAIFFPGLLLPISFGKGPDDILPSWKTGAWVFATFAIYLLVFYYTLAAFFASVMWAVGIAFAVMTAQVLVGAGVPREQKIPNRS